MKNLNKFLFAGIAAICLAGFASCNDDDEAYDFEGYSYDRAYFENCTSLAKGSFIITPASYVNSMDVTLVAKTTANAKQNVVLTVKADPTLVEQYNKDNGTSYVALPAEAVTLSSNTLTIPEGKSVSQDTIHVTVAESYYAKLAVENYLLPMVITETNNDGYKPSSDCAIRFIWLKVSEELFNKGSMSPLGSMISDYSAFKFVEGDGCTESGMSAVLGKSGTWSWSKQEGYAIIDLGADYNITGASVRTMYSNYASWYGEYYMAEHIGMELSTDGSKWVDAGILERGDFGCDSSGYQYMVMYGAVPARYVKLNMRFMDSYSYYCRIQSLRFYAE